MKISSRLKECIYEVSFGYNPKMEGYTTLMSDIPKLYEMPSPAFSKRIKKFQSLKDNQDWENDRKILYPNYVAL